MNIQKRKFFSFTCTSSISHRNKSFMDLITSAQTLFFQDFPFISVDKTLRPLEPNNIEFSYVNITCQSSPLCLLRSAFSKSLGVKTNSIHITTRQINFCLIKNPKIFFFFSPSDKKSQQTPADFNFYLWNKSAKSQTAVFRAVKCRRRLNTEYSSQKLL